MIKIDPDWEKNFSDIQRKYIKLSLNKPIYDELMDFFDNIVVSDYLESFFDGNGFTKEFYDFVFTNCNSIKDISKILLKVPDTNKNCNDLEIKLLKMPEKFLDTYQYFLWYRIRNNNPLSRDELSKYFNGKEFTQDYYKEIMFSNIDNLDKYKEHYNELQIAFIKKFNGNIIANKLFWKCGVTADNLGDYFYIDGSELKISKKGFRILFNEKQWGILEKFSL